MNKIKILRQFHMHDNVKLISTAKAKWISKSDQEKIKKAIHMKYKEMEEMTQNTGKKYILLITVI